MKNVFEPQRVQAICFDIDGTLVDTDDAYVQRLAHALRPLRFLYQEEKRRALARRLVMAAETPTNAILSLLDRLSLDQALRPMLDALHRMRGEANPQHLQLIPGMRAVLETLMARYTLAIVTARERRSTETFLRATNLEALFHCVATAYTPFGSALNRRTKPHPAPVLWAADQMDVPPQACLMVGDTTVDIRAGVAAGAQTVGVLCGFGERGELERAGADLILESTTELADVLLADLERPKDQGSGTRD